MENLESFSVAKGISRDTIHLPSLPNEFTLWPVFHSHHEFAFWWDSFEPWKREWKPLTVHFTVWICQHLMLKGWQWPQDWKRSVFIPVPKKGNAKECSNYCTIAFISHTGKVMLKIIQARIQQYVNRETPDVQAGFRKGRGTRDQIANIDWIIKKAREFYFYFINYAKAFDCVGHNKLENSSRGGNNRPPYLPPEKSVCRSRSNS